LRNSEASRPLHNPQTMTRLFCLQRRLHSRISYDIRPPLLVSSRFRRAQSLHSQLTARYAALNVGDRLLGELQEAANDRVAVKQVHLNQAGASTGPLSYNRRRVAAGKAVDHDVAALADVLDGVLNYNGRLHARLLLDITTGEPMSIYIEELRKWLLTQSTGPIADITQLTKLLGPTWPALAGSSKTNDERQVRPT
jgi:hypothetical protein